MTSQYALMPVATTYASAEVGIEAPLVCVEAEVSAGLPRVQIVGMPETAVRESKDRVKAAITSCGFDFPSRNITINLAPADLPKSGGRYDLAIALAVLAATGLVEPASIAGLELLGELSLTGELRPVRGVLPAALHNKQRDRMLIVPSGNTAEAGLAGSDKILVARNLSGVVDWLRGEGELGKPAAPDSTNISANRLRLSDVRGQAAAKRALTIAAAGRHNLLMIGPPGTGKTMLAMRMAGLLPGMSHSDSLEVASVASVSHQRFDPGDWGHRPFRAPHHTASAAAMVGGGNPPLPGEISLAHQGVLFLDELPEYSRHVLEVLREPLESGEIWISRAGRQVHYPARFQLLAAMNPCPCGYLGDPQRECECAPDRVQRYRARLSGPLLDRIDIHIEVPPLEEGVLSSERASDRLENEEDEAIARQIRKTTETMLTRQGVANSRLSSREVESVCRLTAADRQFLDQSVNRLGISTRGYFKVLKLARTIADLADASQISTGHLAEALGYRCLDRVT